MTKRTWPGRRKLTQPKEGSLTGYVGVNAIVASCSASISPAHYAGEVVLAINVDCEGTATIAL